jgi:phenylacetate-CoA ligase
MAVQQDPRATPADCLLPLWLDARRARHEGQNGIARRRRARLADMVAYARSHSPYYRQLYAGLPDRVEDPSLLPVTDKKVLMRHFDDWVTDGAVTLEAVRGLISDPALIGERFLGAYTALTTSGTTGTPGLFVLDSRTMAVTTALVLRMARHWLGTAAVVKIMARAGRMTLICATGGHYAEVVIAARLRARRGSRAVQILSAHTPLSEMVTQLNKFRPAVVASYASVAVLLAGEQAAGRLRISPVLVTLAAEGLPEGGTDRIANAFAVTPHQIYAATECLFMAGDCGCGWLHVNSDWVTLEAVDARYQPTPVGTRSHTVLVSNLANRVQPILRYDLGDRVVQRPDPCPCGDPFPAIRVEGRTAELLTFVNRRGEDVVIPALLFDVADTAGVELLQVVQVTPAALRVRLRFAPGAHPNRVWQAVLAEITRVLAASQLNNVTVELAEEPAQQSPSGKYRTVIPLARIEQPAHNER